jgi:carboxymethylenebutenolidase
MPKYDLEALWEEHCRYEFETRDVDATMATMVDASYVNHIPTMTGGVGHDQLKRFYKYHFIGANPPDTKLVPVSRIVGTDSLVDEMLFSFTQTSEIDRMLPGVPPTGRKVEVPVVAIVKFRDGKLAQASVLVQIGLLDPDSLPVAGVAEARKMADKTLPSNALMPNWATSDHLGFLAWLIC